MNMKEMTKDQWKSLYKMLEQIYQDFEKAYSESEKGRTKKIRERAYKNAKHEINMANMHIKDHHDAFELLLSEKELSDFQKAINYNEFLKPQYFTTDMSSFLNKIKDVINE